MTRIGAVVLALSALIPLGSFATDNPCESAVAVAVNSKDGVTVYWLKLPLQGPLAHAYLVIPSKAPTAEILFGDNSIVYFGKETGLFNLALDLANGGAACVLLNRTYVWPIEGSDPNRDGDPVECAWQWMRAHLPMDQQTLWYVGPRYTTSSDSQLQVLEDLHGKFCCWVPIGVEESAGGPVNHMNSQGAWQAFADTLHEHIPAFGPVTVQRPVTVAVEDEY